MKQILSFSLLTIMLLFLTYSCEEPPGAALLPVLTTTEVSLITEASAQSGGLITSDAGVEITVRGVCWSTSPNPKITDSITKDAAGTGRFISNISGLTPDITYYLRAYATNKKGTTYGLQETFTTKSLGLTTTEVTTITVNSAKSGGNIAISGDSSNIIARGVCWNTQPNPTIQNYKTSDGKGIGNFSSSLTDLNVNTNYYVRSYATNSGGTYYGNEVSFATNYPTITTNSISNISYTTATCGGEITSEGGATITARGVCWSTSSSPTIANKPSIGSNETHNGIGTGIFTSNLTRLIPNTTYFVRAYATNSIGTAYGEQITFTALATTIPTIITNSISNISYTTATCGGEITSEGGATITARGVCWSTSSSPTIAHSKTANGTGIGSFTSNITGLTAGTTYYVRAYSTNSVGTAYGEIITFSTINSPAGEGEIYNPITGKIWMDKNLGASRVATSSTDSLAYGDLYQWGRATDGHEKRNSLITSTLSSSDTPGHEMFITMISSKTHDWRSPQNNNLWQGVNGINNPCPNGYRLPTSAEWDAERLSWSSNNSAGAFASPLKLSAAGARGNNDDPLPYNVGSFGDYWSSTVDGIKSQRLYFGNSVAGMGSGSRKYGFCVRCIKD